MFQCISIFYTMITPLDQYHALQLSSPMSTTAPLGPGSPGAPRSYQDPGVDPAKKDSQWTV